MGWIKVCGVTSVEQAEMVAAAGVDAIGINLWSRSPRFVEDDLALAMTHAVESVCEVVWVIVNFSEERILSLLRTYKPDRLQLHGDESAEFVRQFQPYAYRAVGLATDTDATLALTMPGEFVLIDAKDGTRRGGTGSLAPLSLAARVCSARRAVLAGGLTPDNVERAIRQTRPFGVDVASGVEFAPGLKDPEKVRDFVATARAAWQAAEHGE